MKAMRRRFPYWLLARRSVQLAVLAAFALGRFPVGLSEFESDETTRGVRGGLGISLSGAGLNPSWLDQQGYERAEDDSHLSIVSEKYNADLRERLLVLSRGNDIAMLNHRGLQLAGGLNEDGRPADASQGLETNLRAFYEILGDPQYSRAEYHMLSPAPWPSPWWLDRIDSFSVGVPAGETQQMDWSRPAPQPRDDGTIRPGSLPLGTPG